MYRYLLFKCPRYYPAGGMHDCVFKTNDFNELEPFINEYCNEIFWGHIHCYDVVEDKVIYAKMEDFENSEGSTKQRFLSWKETVL